MPIPNVSTLYQRINKGSEGGQEFARIITELLIAEGLKSETNFQSFSDAAGDFRGLDFVEFGDPPLQDWLVGYQFKFFPQKLSSNQKAEILRSLEAAITQNPYMQKWVLISPEDFLSRDIEWFFKVKKEFEKPFVITNREYGNTFGRLFIFHWGHSRLVELCLRNEHIGRHYFPELFPNYAGRLKLSKAEISRSKSAWIKSNQALNFYKQGGKNGFAYDPVFDFRFVNDSNETCLLSKIEIILENVWSDIKGISAEYTLKSIGVLEIEVDFDNVETTLILEDPVIFRKNKPLRFHLQLTNFTEKCLGNCASLHFRFHFDTTMLISETFTLSW